MAFDKVEVVVVFAIAVCQVEHDIIVQFCSGCAFFANRSLVDGSEIVVDDFLGMEIWV